MMQALAADEARILEDLRLYFEDELAPYARQAERSGGVSAACVQSLSAKKLLALTVPQALGGLGYCTQLYFQVIALLSQTSPSLAVAVSVTNMVAELIVRVGTPSQCEHYVKGIAEGRIGLASFALSEVDAGSDPAAIRTRAKVHTDAFELAGQKQWVSHGDRAGVLVVWARTGESNTKGLSAFLVPGDHPQKRVTRHEDKMGLSGSSTVALAFDACMLPQDALLGELHRGFKLAMMALDGGRIGISAQSTGVSRRVLDLMKAHVAADTNRGIAELADAQVDWDAAYALGVRAAQLKDRGTSFTKEAAMAKMFASEAAWRIIQRAMQVMGDEACTRGHPVEQAFRDIRVAQIYEGTNQIQRLVIARALLEKV